MTTRRAIFTADLRAAGESRSFRGPRGGPELDRRQAVESLREQLERDDTAKQTAPRASLIMPEWRAGGAGSPPASISPSSVSWSPSRCRSPCRRSFSITAGNGSPRARRRPPAPRPPDRPGRIRFRRPQEGEDVGRPVLAAISPAAVRTRASPQNTRETSVPASRERERPAQVPPRAEEYPADTVARTSSSFGVQADIPVERREVRGRPFLASRNR